MKIAKICVMAAALAGFVAPAAAQWKDITTDNFVYQGDIASIKAQRLVADLEMFQSAIVSSLSSGSLPVLPVRIFAVKDSAELGGVLPYENYSVLSQNSLSGPVFLVHESAVDQGSGESYYPLLRELALHVIRASAPDQYPYWMQSGLADYWAGSKFGESHVWPGQPIEVFEYPLSLDRWTPMKAIVSSLNAPEFDERGGESLSQEPYHQAQSWAAMKYIMSRPDLSAHIPSYLDRLDSGQAPRKAFKRAFGMSVKGFEKRLRKAERQQNNLPDAPKSMTMPRPFIPAAKPLGQETSAAAYAKLLQTFALTEGGLALASQNYGASGLGRESRAMGLVGQAEIAATLGDFAQAHIFMEQAASLDGNDPQFQKRAGSFYLSQYRRTEDLEWLKPAREHFQTALLDLEADPALSLSYATICAQIECPEGGDVKAAIRALTFFRDAAYIDTNLAVLPLLDEKGEFDYVIKFAEFASIWGASAESRNRAKTILKAVKRKKAKVVN